MPNNIDQSFGIYRAKIPTNLNTLAGFGAAVNIVYRLRGGLYESWRLQDGTFNFFNTTEVDGLYLMNASVALDYSNVFGPANFAGVSAGGGPLTNITGLTEGSNTLLIPNRSTVDIYAFYRNGKLLTPTTHYTLSQSGNNGSITLSPGVEPIRPEEVNTPTSFQYQTNN